MNPRYVAVPASALRVEMDEIADSVAEAGGTARWTRVGAEEVLEFRPRGAAATVRVFTTLDGGMTVRECGADAVRICLVDGDRALAPSRKLLRTAPNDGSDRVRSFLDRLRGALRDAYRDARTVPICPDCGRAMSRRKGKFGEFLGCVGYPACSKTRPIPVE